MVRNSQDPFQCWTPHVGRDKGDVFARLRERKSEVGRRHRLALTGECRGEEEYLAAGRGRSELDAGPHPPERFSRDRKARLPLLAEHDGRTCAAPVAQWECGNRRQNTSPQCERHVAFVASRCVEPLDQEGGSGSEQQTGDERHRQNERSRDAVGTGGNICGQQDAGGAAERAASQTLLGQFSVGGADLAGQYIDLGLDFGDLLLRL